MVRFADLLKISTLSVALLSGSALVVAVVTPDVAYAGKGNGNGGGNSGSNGNAGGNGDKAGNSSASNGKAVGRSDSGSRTKSTSRGPVRSLSDLLRGKSRDRKVRRSAQPKTKTVTARAPKTASAPAPKPKGNPLAHELGVHPNELGALNAAHASPSALANASPNSRVGKLANYMDEVEASRELLAELEVAQDELAMLDEPTRSQEEIDAAISIAEGEILDLDDELASLNQQLADAGGNDAGIEAQIVDVETALAAKDEEIADLQQERADGEAYRTALDDVERIESELETQEADQRMALEDAANKPVTDEVEVAVQKLLGIYEGPETLQEEDVSIVIEDEVIVVE